MDGFRRIMLIFITITVINVLLFVLISLIIGGTAVNGKVVENHYYVGDHGEYREVSPLVYKFGLIHSYSLIISILFLGIPAGKYLFHVVLQETREKIKLNE
jgi:hypothetical protein